MTTKTATKNTLAEKMIKIMHQCAYIQKDAQVNFGSTKYTYISAAAVLERVNAALSENRVASFARSQILTAEFVKNGKGIEEKYITVNVEMTLVDVDSGETMVVSGLGSGQDVGDKAIAKAQTMAIKYLWTTTLNISTGDDPEDDDKNHHSNNSNKGSKDNLTEQYIQMFDAATTTEEWHAISNELSGIKEEFSEYAITRIRLKASEAKRRFNLVQN